MFRKYVVDSNFFIQARRDNYPLDIAFSFWSRVRQLAANGTIISIDKARNELYDKNDALENWCRTNLPDDFFKDSSEVMADKQDISDFFALHHSVFVFWLHTLSYVRNICAHHARLWNREFAIKPEILLKPQKPWIISSFNNNQRTFYFLCSLKYLLWGVNPNNHFSAKLDRLFK
jgi:hypothetical protein